MAVAIVLSVLGAAAVIAILAFICIWLLPVVTAGAITLSFIQAVALVALAMLARLVLFSRK